jgi:hypothetical protein
MKVDIWTDFAAVVAGGLVEFADYGHKVHDTLIARLTANMVLSISRTSGGIAPL